MKCTGLLRIYNKLEVQVTNLIVLSHHSKLLGRTTRVYVGGMLNLASCTFMYLFIQ